MTKKIFKARLSFTSGEMRREVKLISRNLGNSAEYRDQRLDEKREETANKTARAREAAKNNKNRSSS